MPFGCEGVWLVLVDNLAANSTGSLQCLSAVRGFGWLGFDLGNFHTYSVSNAFRL